MFALKSTIALGLDTSKYITKKIHFLRVIRVAQKYMPKVQCTLGQTRFGRGLWQTHLPLSTHALSATPPPPLSHIVHNRHIILATHIHNHHVSLGFCKQLPRHSPRILIFFCCIARCSSHTWKVYFVYDHKAQLRKMHNSYIHNEYGLMFGCPVKAVFMRIYALLFNVFNCSDILNNMKVYQIFMLNFQLLQQYILYFELKKILAKKVAWIEFRFVIDVWVLNQLCK